MAKGCSNNDTICAIATGAGNAGVGIVRVSGAAALKIGQSITKKTLPPRLATYAKFYDASNEAVDFGVAIYFKAPNSFTGEDIVELQGHGGQIVLNQILNACISMGARVAKPGEFSERAFLNDKIDLAQAEAIASLIHANTNTQAKAAINSLKGEFSDRVHFLVEKITNLRLFVEAALDFPDEDIDFIGEHKIQEKVELLLHDLNELLISTKQGVILSSGIKVALAGRANAGKSSILNRLTKNDTAIVTDIAGTTRDVIDTKIVFAGLELNILDTAGLRHTDDIIEQEGIRRTMEAVSTADLVLIVVDYAKEQELNPDILFPEHKESFNNKKIIVIANKIDAIDLESKIIKSNDITAVLLSAKNNSGFDKLEQAIKSELGVFDVAGSVYSARERHVNSLERAKVNVEAACHALQKGCTPELVAEDLKCAQDELSEITGEFTSDDLLGKIFSEFCIGK